MGFGMTSRAIFRNAALTFPEVTEEEREGKVVYAVRGKQFAALTTNGMVHLRLPADEASRAIATYPTAEQLLHAGRPIGFAAPLRDVGGQHIWSLTMAAWKHRAPKRLAAQVDTIIASENQPGSDLPSSIGKAATRALLMAGIVTLDDVATKRASDLLAMHGVGPKAVRILADALSERGQSLR